MSAFEKSHAVILVESEGRNENTSSSPTNFIYQLTYPVKFFKRSRNKQYFVRVENIRIPVSFYNINSNYDTFGWTGSATGAVSFDGDDFDHGNYTIDELIAEVQTQMNVLDNNTYTITYNEITQKVNIASTGTEDISTLVGDGWRTLGFDLTETITGASNVDGTNVAYTNTTRHLKLSIDSMNSGNVYTNTTSGNKTTNIQPVMVEIPITQTRNEFVFYDNHDGYKIKMPNIPSVNDFRVKLLDPENNIVDLNNVPWGFSVVFYELNISPWLNK